jgi:hypothetical protein
MARMTAADIVALIRKGMGNPSTDEWPDNELLRFANLAILEIIASDPDARTEMETYSDITTTSGTAAYELSVSNVLKITSVLNVTDNIRLKRLNRDDHTRQDVGQSETGDPTRYFESGIGSNSRKQVVLWVTPNATKTIRVWYIKIPDEIVLLPAATSPEMSQEWDLTIVKLATATALEFDAQRREAGAQYQSASASEGKASGSRARGTEKRWGLASSAGQAASYRSRR